MSETIVLGLTKPAFNEAGWADALNQNLDLIDAAIGQGIFFVGYRGNWIADTLYKVNDIAIDAADGNSVWKCLVENTSPSAGSFLDDRTSNPTYWEEQTTAAASAASAQASATTATIKAIEATASATNALTQAGAALTQATNAQGFAAASAISATASAASAATSAASVASITALRASEVAYLLAMPVTAITNTEFTITVPAGYILEIYQRTKTAYTGGTVNLTIGTALGGAQVVAAVNVAAKAFRRLTLVDASADILSPFAGGTLYVRLNQSAPAAVGDGVIFIKLQQPV